jgi:hypothetical protein
MVGLLTIFCEHSIPTCFEITCAVGLLAVPHWQDSSSLPLIRIITFRTRADKREQHVSFRRPSMECGYIVELPREAYECDMRVLVLPYLSPELNVSRVSIHAINMDTDAIRISKYICVLLHYWMVREVTSESVSKKGKEFQGLSTGAAREVENSLSDFTTTSTG